MEKQQQGKTVLIIGSGPIIIGQACEFDYSGTQACKALRRLGWRVVLVNSNPATVMTDPGMADATYIEPLNAHRLEQIIEKEKPDALLPNLGGQSGLNLCEELWETGVLDKHGVQVIGVQPDAIHRGEDRVAFKQTMNELGVEMARSEVAYSVDEAAAIAARLSYPVVLRPAFTMGGTGGGLVHDEAELRVIAARGLAASLVHQVLVEESVLGWEELELEVVRDASGKLITVCFIENIDPLGVHTGDSFCAAPMLTIPEDVQAQLQEIAYRIVERVGVIGGTNVQFARDPETGRIIVIEINPRTSRSSALASKATGFPIAYVSAELATGLNLCDLPCGKCGSLDRYRPSGDYVVIKFARWAFEKFKGAVDTLGTQMRAVGEVMSIGKTYKEAFQKAICSLENGRTGLGFARDFYDISDEELYARLARPSSERQFLLYEALRRGADVNDLFEMTKIKHWFLTQMQELVKEEEALLSGGLSALNAETLRRAKEDGFSDVYLARLLQTTEEKIRMLRHTYGIEQAWEGVFVSGTADSSYYYSTYHATNRALAPQISANRKIMILGSGPNRIGQGIEFDYCCVHAAKALRAAGYETVMVNCNPETVSTDYDTADRLYFEPLTVENVLNIYEAEKPLGVIVQFGGQTPLNIADRLQAAGVTILGTQPSVIDAAEDRDLFRAKMAQLGIPMPESEMAATAEEAMAAAEKIGYPVMVRPSFVLGGRGMAVIESAEALADYMRTAEIAPDRPILVDRFLRHAVECEADAVCDGTRAAVPAVMEHVELAGIHSGDSACYVPAVALSESSLAVIRRDTARIAESLGVVGLLNVQFAIENERVFVIEANPRASRTVPLVSKVSGVNMVTEAISCVLCGMDASRPRHEMKVPRAIPYVGVKEAVLPYNMFPEVDPVLGPEMHATGEVLALASTREEALLRAWEATGSALPAKGTVLFSISDRDKEEAIPIARQLTDAGYTLLATPGTYAQLAAASIPATRCDDPAEELLRGEIALFINTPTGRHSLLRRDAITARVPYITTLAAAKAVASALAAHPADAGVRSLQEWHRMLVF